MIALDNQAMTAFQIVSFLHGIHLLVLHELTTPALTLVDAFVYQMLIRGFKDDRRFPVDSFIHPVSFDRVYNYVREVKEKTLIADFHAGGELLEQLINEIERCGTAGCPPVARS